MKSILISDLTTNVNINEGYYDFQTFGIGPRLCLERIVSVVKREKGMAMKPRLMPLVMG
jgi:hypothetical protein